MPRLPPAAGQTCQLLGVGGVVPHHVFHEAISSSMGVLAAARSQPRHSAPALMGMRRVTVVVLMVVMVVVVRMGMIRMRVLYRRAYMIVIQVHKGTPSPLAFAANLHFDLIIPHSFSYVKGFRIGKKNIPSPPLHWPGDAAIMMKNSKDSGKRNAL